MTYFFFCSYYCKNPCCVERLNFFFLMSEIIHLRLIYGRGLTHHRYQELMLRKPSYITSLCCKHRNPLDSRQILIENREIPFACRHRDICFQFILLSSPDCSNSC